MRNVLLVVHMCLNLNPNAIPQAFSKLNLLVQSLILTKFMTNNKNIGPNLAIHVNIGPKISLILDKAADLVAIWPSC